MDGAAQAEGRSPPINAGVHVLPPAVLAEVVLAGPPAGSRTAAVEGVEADAALDLRGREGSRLGCCEVVSQDRVSGLKESREGDVVEATQAALQVLMSDESERFRGARGAAPRSSRAGAGI